MGGRIMLEFRLNGATSLDSNINRMAITRLHINAATPI